MQTGRGESSSSRGKHASHETRRVRTLKSFHTTPSQHGSRAQRSHTHESSGAAEPSLAHTLSARRAGGETRAIQRQTDRQVGRKTHSEQLGCCASRLIYGDTTVRLGGTIRPAQRGPTKFGTATTQLPCSPAMAAARQRGDAATRRCAVRGARCAVRGARCAVCGTYEDTLAD